MSCLQNLVVELCLGLHAVTSVDAANTGTYDDYIDIGRSLHVYRIVEAESLEVMKDGKGTAGGQRNTCRAPELSCFRKILNQGSERRGQLMSPRTVSSLALVLALCFHSRLKVLSEWRYGASVGDARQLSIGCQSRNLDPI